MSIARILILSGDALFRRMVNDCLARQDFEMVECPPVSSAGAHAEVIIADLDGLSAGLWRHVAQLRRLDASVALILVSARWPSLSHMHAWRPCGYVRKPFSMADMLRVVHDLVTRRSGWAQADPRDRQVQSGCAAVG